MSVLESRVRQDRSVGETADRSVSPPKFSTTVEKTVENKALLRKRDKMTRFMRVSYQGESYKDWIFRCLARASSSHSGKTGDCVGRKFVPCWFLKLFRVRL